MDLSILYSPGFQFAYVMEQTCQSLHYIRLKPLAMIVKNCQCVLSNITKMKIILSQSEALFKLRNFLNNDFQIWIGSQ